MLTCHSLTGQLPAGRSLDWPFITASLHFSPSLTHGLCLLLSPLSPHQDHCVLLIVIRLLLKRGSCSMKINFYIYSAVSCTGSRSLSVHADTCTTVYRPALSPLPASLSHSSPLPPLSSLLPLSSSLSLFPFNRLHHIRPGFPVVLLVSLCLSRSLSLSLSFLISILFILCRGSIAGILLD